MWPIQIRRRHFQPIPVTLSEQRALLSERVVARRVIRFAPGTPCSPFAEVVMKKLLLSLLTIIALSGAVLMTHPNSAVASPINPGTPVDQGDQGDDDDSQ